VNAALRSHLLHIDRALLALLDERARLMVELDHSGSAAIDDLLRRHEGPLAAAAVREFFAAADRACLASSEQHR
jgi:chorismate mutase